VVCCPSRRFVHRRPRKSPGDSQSVLSLVTFFGLAKKVTRLPAGTGEVRVFLPINPPQSLRRIKNENG
jgi:hypothetical protein